LSAGTGDAILQIYNTVAPYLYTPYLGGFPLSFSVEHKNSVAMKMQIAVVGTGSGEKYWDNNGDGQISSYTDITFPALVVAKDVGNVSLINLSVFRRYMRCVYW